MNNNTFIVNALAHIANAYKQEDLTLERVAEQAGFSVSYFNHIFAESTGKSVMEYVREYKLIRAAQTLRTSSAIILDIALDFGYANPENFARAFKGRYGVSPSDYREKHKNSSLTWKDASTGTAISRFEREYPQFKRVDMDVFTDWLYTQNPIRYAFQIYFASQIDCAVYQLSEQNEYLYIEEYRPEEMHLTLFCQDKNIRKWLSFAKLFPQSRTCLICGPEFVCPDDNYGFDQVDVRYDYAYLKQKSTFSLPEGYRFCRLASEDKAAVKAFSKRSSAVVWQVFEQNMCYSNYAETKFFGLFKGETLIACCMPEEERAKGIAVCEIGGIFFVESEKTDMLYQNFWKAVIEDCMQNNLIPTNGGVSPRDTVLSCADSEELGYSLVAKRCSFLNGYQQI